MDTKKTYKIIKEDLTQFTDKYFSEDKEIISFLYKLLDELKEKWDKEKEDQPDFLDMLGLE